MRLKCIKLDLATGQSLVTFMKNYIEDERVTRRRINKKYFVKRNLADKGKM